MLCFLIKSGNLLKSFAKKTRLDKSQKGFITWVGETPEGGQVVLTSRGNILFGTINLNGESYEIAHAGGDVHYVTMINQAKVANLEKTQMQENLILEFFLMRTLFWKRHLRMVRVIS